MLPPRNSLRFRILCAFAVAGLCLGPLIGVALLYLSMEAQERGARSLVQGQLKAALDQPQRYRFQDVDNQTDMFLLTTAAPEHIPSALFELPPGIHEYESGPEAWMVAVGEGPSGRFVVVEDVSHIEGRERFALGYGLAGALLATVVALMLGYWLARWLTTPLERLTAAVTAEQDNPPGTALTSDREQDEVARLARAIERYRRDARETLEREQRFSADVSHELRTPLTIIQNAAELIEADQGLGVRSRQALGRLITASRRMEETSATLLALLREGADLEEIERVSVVDRARAVIEDEIAAAGAGQHQVSLEARATPALPVPTKVIDVLIGNLVRNALQHANASRIRVIVEANRLIVDDDGVGILPQTQPASANGGHGLGLSLIERLCQRYGWTLTLQCPPSGGTHAIWRYQD